jgi:hypothetical protein
VVLSGLVWHRIGTMFLIYNFNFNVCSEANLLEGHDQKVSAIQSLVSTLQLADDYHPNFLVILVILQLQGMAHIVE